MNEHQVEDILVRHGQRIAETRPVASVRRIAWKPALAMGVGVAAIAMLMLAPRYAEAARIERFKRAIKGARSVDQHWYTRVNGGSWHEFMHIISEGDSTRTNARMGTGIEFTILANSQWNLIDYSHLPFATLTKTPESELVETDLLKSLLALLDGNPDKKVYKYSTSSGEPLNGRKTYVIDYSRADTNQKMHIIVDAATDLPIEAYMWRGPDDFHGITTEENRITYTYNNTYDQKLFALPTNKKIVNPDKEKVSLKRRWEENAKVAPGLPPIYETTVGPDGTIWIAFGVKEGSNVEKLPCEVLANGKRYLHVIDISASFRAINEDYRVGGREVIMTPFVAAYDDGTLPTKAEIRFAKRIEGQPEGGALGKIPEKLDDAISKSYELKPESEVVPSYMPSLGFDKERLSMPMQFWRKKALARQKLGDYVGAIDAYQHEIQGWNGFVRYKANEAMIGQATCYAAMGDQAKADILMKQAKELKQSMVR